MDKLNKEKKFRIPFNRPTLAGRELEYIVKSVRSGHAAGDGLFTKKCHLFFERKFAARKVLLTTSCTAALEMAAILFDVQQGDEVIRETARILIRATQQSGNVDDFIGHVGGDDYVVVTTPDKVDVLCKTIIESFEKALPAFYAPNDYKNGFIIAHDRQGKEQQIPLLSISIGVVTNESRKIEHIAEIGEIGAELKEYAKSLERSNYVKDKRAIEKD